LEKLKIAEPRIIETETFHEKIFTLIIPKVYLNKTENAKLTIIEWLLELILSMIKK